MRQGGAQTMDQQPFASLWWDTPYTAPDPVSVRGISWCSLRSSYTSAIVRTLDQPTGVGIVPYTSRRYSLRQDLMLLVMVCVLPAGFVSATLAYSTYRLQREHMEQETELKGQAILSDLEREFATIESALKILATSQELVSGDMRGFYQRARDALVPGIVYSYVLTDPEGQQLVNTLRPFGTALPPGGRPPKLAHVFTGRATVLTDIFSGPVAGKPVVVMGVPVVLDGKVKYSLSVGLDPVQIAALVSQAKVPKDWVAAILDSSATIVGRSREADRYVGEKAVPELVTVLAKPGSGHIQTVTKDGVQVITAYVRSQVWSWTVAVGAPRSALDSNIVAQLARVFLGIAVAVGLGLWWARAISLRVLASVRQLNEAALSLGNGEEMRLPSMQLQEAEAVGAAMVQAAQAMKKVKFFAQHDALTELPNRLLFDEVAERNLARAERKGQLLALLALDLDGFKAVNDTLGHAAGDEVLKTVAQRILEVIRASDIAARIGGDEFIIVLADVTLDSAMETAERVVAMLSLPYPNVSLRVSASVGVAMYPECGTTLKELFSSADRALYQAKATGKDRALLAQRC
jgi:diguanylate cyclase (GGDEF)-like protein